MPDVVLLVHWTLMYRKGSSASNERLDARIARFASRRHGLISHAEALRMGATARIIQRRIASQRWERLHIGVYRVAGTPDSWRQQVLSACLAAGVGAAASHLGAAPLLHLAGFEPAQVEISVPTHARPRLRGVVVHRVNLPKVDIAVLDAIPVTTPTRTLLDLAAVADAEAVEEALDDALRRGLTSVPRIRWRLEELGRRPGARVMRRLLDGRTLPAERVQSVLETRFLRAIKRAGLPEPACQHEVRDGGRLVAVVDFAYPEARFAIEVDGYRWHSGRRAWQHDLARRNHMTRLGWSVIHVTADDVKNRWVELFDAIDDVLRTGGDLGAHLPRTLGER